MHCIRHDMKPPCELNHFCVLTTTDKPYNGLGYCPFYGGDSDVVDSLFIVVPIVCRGSLFGSWFGIHVVRYILSSLTIIVMWKRELLLRRWFCCC